MTLLLVGMLTMYAGQYVDQPLRCGGVYDTTHEWIAVDIDALPGWRCNDLVRVTVGDDVMLLPVRDSGPLSLYFIDTPGGLVPIVADLPAHSFPWPGLSVQGTLENLTGRLRQIGALDAWNEERQEATNAESGGIHPRA